ncbi:hypothetical protein HK102_008455 [Quaeritorhiza haematococci]|nr:hypothetical protein HK102_008455 [Quaeritorhiza haematococci]
MQCKRADDMVTEYVSLYSEEMHGVEDKEEYYDRSDFLKHHTQIANKVLRDFIAELESLPVFASVDSRRKHVLSLSKEIRRRQQHLASVIDRKSKERNMAIADAEWKVYVDSISKQVLLGTGLKAARCLVKLIDSFARAYMRQAKGPSKLSHMMRFLEGKGSWINSVISLSKLYDEIAKDELRQLEEIQRVVKDYKIIEALFVSEAASAMSMQINAELEIVLNQVPLTVENAAAVINAQLTETQNDLAASFAVTTEQINTATQQGIANAQAELDASLGEMRQMQNTLSEAQQVTEAAATDLANKKPALPAWLQGLIGGAITLAGVALTALTGGAGAVIGGMLISAGMSATMQSFSGAKVSLEDFGKGVGIGLATGLVTAGFGAAAGAAIKCATQAFVETGKSVLTSMATSAIISATSSCASNVLSTVIDNACNPPRPIGQGLATAAVIGAVGGAIGGAVSGFSSHTKYAAKLKQAAQLKEAIDVAPKAAIPAMKTLGKSAKQMLVSTAEGSANGVVGAAIGAGMTGQDAGSAIAQGAWQGAFGGAVGGLTQAGRNFRKRHVQNQKLRAAEAAGKLQQDGTYPITIITDPANGNQHIDHSNLHIDGLISDTEQMARISLAIDQDTTRAGVSVPPPDRPRWLQKRDPATGGTLMTNDAGQPAFGRHARTSNSSAFFNVGVQQRAVGSVPAGHHGPYNVPRLDTPNYPWYRVDKFMTRLGRDRYTFGDGVKNVGLKDKPKFQKINNLKEARVAHLPNLTSHPKFPSNLSKFSKLADQYCAGVRTRDMIKPVVQNVKKTVVQNVKKADKDD